MFESYRAFIPDFDGFLEALRAPMDVHIRANPARISGEALRAGLAAAGVDVRPLPFYADGLRIAGLERPGATLEWFAGLYHLQGATSMIPPLALDVRPGHRVLDLCAAPGSKATQIASLIGDGGVVIANDRFLDRLALLKTHLERMGHVNACLTNKGADAFPSGMRFDRVLADVPCSGEGTERVGAGGSVEEAGLRQREERHARAADLARMRRLQKAILLRAANLVRPGGLLVYSTCTYAPEENELILDEVLRARPDLELEPVPEALGGEPGLTRYQGRALHPALRNARRYYPHRAWNSWGFFCARLRRTDAGRPAGPDADRVWSLPRPAAEEADQARALEALAPYGVDAGSLAPLRVVRAGGADWLLGPALPHPEHLAPWRPQNPGLRLFRVTAAFAKPSTFACMRLGALLRRQVVDLAPDEIAPFLRGAPIDRHFPGLDRAGGYLVARAGGRVLGCGLLTRAGLVGQVPRRLGAAIDRSLLIAPDAPFPPPEARGG